MRNRRFTKILLGLCTISLLAGTVGCSDKQTEPKATPASQTQQNTKPDYNEDENSNLGAWARAMGSVLIYLNDGNPYYFGGYQITEDNKTAAVNILSGSWNIKDRKSLLTQIQSLLSEGDRKEYREEAADMNAMSKKSLKLAMKQLSGDVLVHYQMVQYNWKTWKKKGLLAWDMCRVSHLVQWGYIAGYVNREEAQALIEPAARKLKDNFSSWEEVQHNWLDGYCVFANVDRNASNTDYTNRKALYETLVREQSKEEPLYDDALFTGSITPVTGTSYRTILDEIKPKATKTPAKKKTGKKKSGNGEKDDSLFDTSRKAE